MTCSYCRNSEAPKHNRQTCPDRIRDEKMSHNQEISIYSSNNQETIKVKEQLIWTKEYEISNKDNLNNIFTEF